MYVIICSKKNSSFTHTPHLKPSATTPSYTIINYHKTRAIITHSSHTHTHAQTKKTISSASSAVLEDRSVEGKREKRKNIYMYY